MSVENAKRFLEAAGTDRALQSKLGTARDLAELIPLAIQASTERGLPFTAEEFIASIKGSRSGAGELEDGELDRVAGGLAAGSTPSQQAGLESFVRTLTPSALRELLDKYYS